MEENFAILTQITVILEENNGHNIGFEEKRQKLAKMAKNSDHNNDPRVFNK
jgi:hypothetical protein